MLPVKWNDTRNLLKKTLFDDFENLWGGLWKDFDAAFGTSCRRMDDSTVVYEFEVPGFNKDNLTVEVADGIATITGKREVGENRVGKREIFQRVSVGEVEDVKASIKDGILSLTLMYPKKEEAKKKVEIEG